MPKITSIEIQKRNPKRVSIYLDGQFYTGISLFVCHKLKLKKDMEIDESTLNSIIYEENLEEGKKYAMKHLCDKPEKDVRTKLKRKEYSEDIIEKIVQLMKGYHLIDDKKYAIAYAHDALKFKKHGKNKIKLFLKSKGIDDDIISEALKHLAETDEVETAVRKLKTKYNRYLSNSKNEFELRQKCISFLIRSGFDFDLSQKATDIVIDEKS